MKRFLSKLFENRFRALAVITVVVVALDQWTKELIHGQFRLGQSINVIPSLFDLTYVRNKGAAFGLCHKCPPAFRDTFFLIVPVIALGIIFFLISRLTNRQKWVGTALSLITGGAIGNVIDRVRLGYVIDFLDFYVGKYHWPAFNVADSCIVVGVAMMFIHSFFPNKFAQPDSPNPESAQKTP